MREIKAGVEISAWSHSGWWCLVMMKPRKLGKAGGGWGRVHMGFETLLGLPMGCQADRSMSSELRGEVWTEI